MIWLHRILTFLVGFGAVYGVLFLVATTYGWEKIWQSTHGAADLGPVEFPGLSTRGTHNQVLICPDGICDDESRHRKSPVYGTDADTLKIAFIKSLESESGLTRVDDGKDPMRMRFVQRSRLLRFPDTIQVQFYKLGNNTHSTLALHGKSQIGGHDLGVNKTRADRWLNRLENLEQ